ncbi:thiamine pyrophosphate-dependent enzyme [Mycolicibacterium sp. 050232]|uniref:thiamine pyrophosphate-dependent enzyme n=1 Tax=Mycolicibacterium sp. 050232 TaxID=3113982 RepID=UPI002E29CB4F|nr:thiamine pyrophosphate-dependent enzyme [Mycolicibacterium sp. 050232]MED5813875.1 thiamine pyrophosphate-dependent enzyme [Mycolicibacterium sp. 050232]
MPTVASALVSALAELGVRQIWGVVGDALNPITNAIRTQEDVEWIGVRHEEVAAFAAGAQAQLTGSLGVCMGTVGPGSLHLLNGLYDAKKSHAPVLAVCGQVPTSEMWSSFFQEIDNDAVFSDVAVFHATVTAPAQFPFLLEQAVNSALARRGVAVLTVPGDIGDQETGDYLASFAFPRAGQVASPEDVDAAAALLNAPGNVAMLVGCGGRDAREEVLSVASTLAAPVVLTMKGKEGLEGENPYQIGQSGLIGNPAAHLALHQADTLLLVGTDFPYRDWLPQDKKVVQLDHRPEHIGRRLPVSTALVGDAKGTLAQLLPKLQRRESTKFLDHHRAEFDTWRAAQRRLAEPDHDRKLLGRIRKHLDNPDELIRPELVAVAVDQAAADDAIFTTDTGMSAVWLSRFVEMRRGRRLLGSFNLGSMANAMPQALGASALDRRRQVIAFCGDGGLMMLLGDLRTAVTYELPATFVVFNNNRLGMVKLEQEQSGLPEYGTQLDNPDIAAVATAMGLHAQLVTSPDDVASAVATALAHEGPALLDIRTNPDEISVPPKPTVEQGWGFAIAKIKETLNSRE